MEDILQLNSQLLDALKQNLPALEELQSRLNTDWGYADDVYRFYHQSFKVYRAQEDTKRIVSTLQGLMPNRELNPWFTEIIQQGTSQVFDDHRSNQNWLSETRPIIEALSHAKFMLEMGIKYAREYETAPQSLDNGWAALLYLYEMR